MKRKLCFNNIPIRNQMITAVTGAILFTVTIIGVLTVVLNVHLPDYYNFGKVNTNEFSFVNQAQWAECVINISNELALPKSDDEKMQKISDITSNFDELDIRYVITKNNKYFCGNGDYKKVKNDALFISKATNCDRNLNHFGEDGLAIIDHVIDKNDIYIIIISSYNYTLKSVTPETKAQTIMDVVQTKTTLIIALFVLASIISVILLSKVTANSVTKPLKAVSKGAQEIANGNLEYEINYESKNEIGTMVKSINEMSKALKDTKEERNMLDQQRKWALAGISHDFRTPLTSIKGYVEGLRDGICTTPEQQKQYLDTIYSSTLVLEHLLDDLKNVTELENSKIQLNAEPTDIGMFIDEYIEETLPKLKKYNLDFNHLNNCKNTIINIDTNKFCRVLDNILQNSIKYKKQNVRLSIKLNAQQYDSRVIISIKDNGVGIKREYLPNIFDLFYRTDQSRTSVKDGSGLGLAICKEIVELHNGTIWATSEYEKGTTIYISLDKLMEDNYE